MCRYQRIFILLLLLSVLSGPGCISDREPFVLLLDEAYVLQLLATRQDGIDSPDGIALESERVLYLSDPGGSTLVKWTEGTGIEILCGSNSGLESPESMVRTEDGILYITDDSAGGVWRFDTGGTLSLLAGPEQGLVSTEGIVIAPDSSLLVGDGLSRTIYRVTRAGSVSVFIASGNSIEKAEAMEFDEDGNLYIADDVQRKIFIVEPGHQPRVLLDSSSGIGAPESLAYRAGHLFFIDGEAGKLYRWSHARRTLDTIAIFHGNLKEVQGIAVSDRGSLFLTVLCRDPDAGYLFKLEPTP